MVNTTAAPLLLTDPGFLFAAIAGTAIPTNTVVGSVFTDAWAGAWVNLGATMEGSRFKYELATDTITVAEFFDPSRIVTTGRSGSIAFALANWTLTNVRKALNAGTGSIVVTGATTTTMSTFTPPTPGTEIRCMIGWESLDATVRLICYQVLNSGSVEMAFRKGTDNAVIPCEFQFEVPTSGIPFTIHTAGVARG